MDRSRSKPQVLNFRSLLRDALRTDDVSVESQTADKRHVVLEDRKNISPGSRQRHSADELHSLNQTRSACFRLVPELWLEIFTRCLPDDTSSFGVDEAPLKLTRVCRSWRNLAISSPSLWSAIYVVAPEYNPNHHDGYLDMLQLWLERSRRFPLSISFTAPYVAHPSVTASIWEILIAHSSRWRTLDITVPDTWVTAFISSSFPKDLPFLESLTIHVTYPDWKRQPLTSLTFHSSSIPRLKTFSLLGVPSVAPSALQLNWSQLSNITIQPASGWELGHFGDLSSCLEILDQAKNLSHFSMFLEAGLNLSRWKGVRLKSNVDSLHIRLRQQQPDDDSAWYISPASYLSNIKTFFACLTLPKVQDIGVEIEWGLARDKWPQEAFTSVLDASSLTVRSLSLKGIPVSETEVLDCLRALPLLTNFTLFAYAGSDPDPIGDLLFRRLSFPGATGDVGDDEEDDIIVPQLQSLDLHGCGYTCTDMTLTNFMSSRMDKDALPPGCACLGSFRFAIWRKMTDELRSSARAWAERGIDVRVTGR